MFSTLMEEFHRSIVYELAATSDLDYMHASQIAGVSVLFPQDSSMMSFFQFWTREIFNSRHLF